MGGDHRGGGGGDPAGPPREAAREFLAALTEEAGKLASIPGRLDEAVVHDQAFGKLIDAAKVRDAYHERLPATKHNITEAADVLLALADGILGTPAADGAEAR